MKRWLCVLLALICAFAVTGCGSDATEETGKEVVLRYNGQNIEIDEVYIYAQTVKEEYESKYGSDVWKQSIVTDDGLEMDAVDAARRQAISKLIKTKTLITKSGEYGISLTASEQKDQDTAAQEFYDKLTDAQIAEVGLELDTVKRVLRESALADKIYEQKKKADAAYESIVEASDGTDMDISFLGSAKELKYAGTHTMSRDDILSTYGQDTLDILYSMSDGEVSTVVETEYGYHIFQMISITDEKATAENKKKLTDAADAEYYDNLMKDWIDELDSGYSYSKSVDMDVYNKIKFDE